MLSIASCSMYALLVALLLLLSDSDLQVSGDVQTCENCSSTVCEYPCHRDNPPVSSGGYPVYGAPPPPPPPAQPAAGGGYPVYGAPPPPYQSGQAKCPPLPPQCCAGSTPGGSGSGSGSGSGYGNAPAPPYSYTPPSPYTYVPYGPNTAPSFSPAAVPALIIFIISSLLSLF